jgi:hypothetical protein
MSHCFLKKDFCIILTIKIEKQQVPRENRIFFNYIPSINIDNLWIIFFYWTIGQMYIMMERRLYYPTSEIILKHKYL